MMASMGPGAFGGHPNAMQQHPGVPGGHPMGPGMPHNPNQQGMPGGGIPPQLAHMGVSGAPGGQIPATMMGGMPPGAGGPNQHALQHLNPGQGPMFPQQQQFANFNGQMQAQLQHQRFFQQQAQARQALFQQMGGNQMAGVNGMPMGIPVHQMNPNQLAALRQGIRPGQHPQTAQLMAHQLALQQQQQQAQQQMGQGGGPGQPMQMTPQHLQNLQNQQAQIQAAAQMQSQASQQGQQPNQGQPQPNQGQPPPPGQPNAQTSQQPQQAGTPAPSGQHTRQQTPGPTPTPQAQQGPQPPQGQGQPQQNQGQQQQQHPQQQQQHPQHPQHPQAQGQVQGQPQGPTQVQLNAAAQQAQAMASSLAMQRRFTEIKGQHLLKLMLFSEHLSGFPGSNGKGDLTYWHQFVDRFFSHKGVFRHQVHIVDGEETDKQYEIAYPALARYFHTYFESGVKRMQFVMDKGTTEKPLPDNSYWIENHKSSFVYWFEGGLHLVANGILRAQFDAEQKIELFEFATTDHEEFVSLKQVIEAAKPAHNWVKEWHKINQPDIKASPEMSKKAKAKQMKSPQNAPPDALVDLPLSAVNKKTGMPEAVFQFLEIVEVMGQMGPLFGYHHLHPGIGAYTALEQYVSQNVQQMPQNMNGQVGGPAGPRTPGFGAFPMGASPATAHIQLPGSPHVGSPVPGHMQAPAMQMQQSHQGTSSSGPSANTSPASNKRRRPSGIKTEEDGGSAPTPAGNQVNGLPGKKNPPTPRLPKKQKTSN